MKWGKQTVVRECWRSTMDLHSTQSHAKPDQTKLMSAWFDVN